jgi:hypothetical protein
MKFSVESDISGLIRRTSFIKPQVRRAAAKAIGWTIYNVRDAQRAGMGSVFDRPTAFTLYKSNLVNVPDVQGVDLTGQWYVRADQSTGIPPVNYLRPNIFGGRRKLKRFELALQANLAMPKGWIAIPGPGAKLDGFGNMSRGQIMQILSVMRSAETTSGYSANQTERSKARNKKPRDYFVSMPNATSPRGIKGRLPYGLYQRLGRGRIVTVLRYRDAHNYKARYDYHGIGMRVSKADFPRLMRKAFKQEVTRALR